MIEQLLILVPFWGNHPAYRAWLDRWLASHRAVAPSIEVMVVSDEVLPFEIDAVKLQVDTRPWLDLVDPAWAYDRKGAIVCAALTVMELAHRPLLVLDADAPLVGDPRPLLAPFADHLIAMPEDEGAFGVPYPSPHDAITRRCAGVMFFGATCLVQRQYLTIFFREHFTDLNTCDWAEERRLLEQHAWTFVAAQLNARLLPRELNWPASIPSKGTNPRAVIHHHIGRRKWAGHDAPPAGVLNAGQLDALTGKGKAR